MGRIIQQNNGKTTVYVTGEDISSTDIKIFSKIKLL